MVKTLIAMRHGCDKEFGVEFYHEKVSSDHGSGFNFVCRIGDCETNKMDEGTNL